jgi:hypothetical protein
MKIEDFQKLLNKSCSLTKNVRGCTNWSSSGVCLIPDETSSKIDCIVSFLQHQINNGKFCKKDEYLMIYNFQPFHISDTRYLCNLDLLIKPISKINDLEDRVGKPLHLVVDAMDGTIADENYGLDEVMGMLEDDEDEVEPVPVPVSVRYGNFLDYLEPKTPQTPETNHFADRLTKLASASFTGMPSMPDMGGESKTRKESTAHKLDTCGHEVVVHDSLTFAFTPSRLADFPSPSSSGVAPFSGVTNACSDIRGGMTSVLVC